MADAELRVTQHEDKLMTIAQQLEQKGIKKGMIQGFEQGYKQGFKQGFERGMIQGIQLGEQREKRTLARTMLQQGMNYVDVMKITGLSSEELITLAG